MDFSRAVLADQRRHLAGIKRDVHVIKRSHTRKGLGDAAHFQNGLVRGGKRRLSDGLAAGLAPDCPLDRKAAFIADT